MSRALALALLAAGCRPAGGGGPAADPLGAAVETARAVDVARILAEGREAEAEALRAAAWSVDPTAPDARLGGLDDPSPYVQLAVVEALGPAPSPAAAAVLAGVAANPERDPLVRARAALSAKAAPAALGWRAARDPGAVLALASAALRLGDPDARGPLEAALAAGELPYDPALLAFVAAAPDPGLAAALARGAASVEEEMAVTVAAARVRLGDPDGAGVLREALADPSVEARAEVVDALVDATGPEAEALLGRAGKDADPFVATYAALVLAARGRGDAGVFARAVGDPDPELRQLAVRLAGRALAADPPARGLGKVLSAGLADADGQVRAEAATAAGAARATELAPALRIVAGDESLPVRLAAAVALVRLGG